MGFPTGHERGRYLTIDFGGTNLRVCNTVLLGREQDAQVTQEKYKLPGVHRDSADQLWDFVAECVTRFLREHSEDLEDTDSKKLPLAFTFSYPVTQTSICSGILQKWSKSLHIPGVEGHEIVSQLQTALDRKVRGHFRHDACN